ncbi:hypothetical protein ABIA39_008219 [Nocardia sp. GAS34]
MPFEWAVVAVLGNAASTQTAARPASSLTIDRTWPVSWMVRRW